MRLWNIYCPALPDFIAEAMDDLWRDEPYLIGRLCKDDHFRAEWSHYRQYRAIAHSPGGRVVRAKKRFIDPLMCGEGRVSQIDAAFKRRVAAFLSDNQDAPMIGI